jgi:hypothetical protein
MVADYSCPFCHAQISLDDMNVATDLALCRACGRTSAFSVVCGASEISQDCLDKPPRHIRVLRGFNDETTVTYRRISPFLLFLIPFMAIWSGVTLGGTFAKQIRDGAFNLAETLAGLPFLLGTVIMLIVVAYLTFGKWVVELNRGNGSVFVGVGPLGWTRRFSYNRATIVSLKMTDATVNNRPQKGILVRTDENDFVFGAFIKDDAKRFIAATIMRQVGQL